MVELIKTLLILFLHNKCQLIKVGFEYLEMGRIPEFLILESGPHPGVSF